MTVTQNLSMSLIKKRKGKTYFDNIMSTSRRMARRISGSTMLAGPVLSEESLSEPVDGTQFRNNSDLPINSTSSRLNSHPKYWFILSTICPGSHVGRVQAETEL